MEGLRLFGKNWRKVEEFIGTRTGAQIRSHAQKVFNRFDKTATNITTTKESIIPNSNQLSEEPQHRSEKLGES